MSTVQPVARQFTIYPGGARRAPRLPPKYIPPGREKEKLIAQTTEEVQSLVDAGTSKSYASDIKTVLSVWADFCALVDLDPNAFGKVGKPSEEQLQQLTIGEGAILSHFLAYVRVRPRNSPRHSKPVSFQSARKYLRVVTDYYHEERGRCPGKFQTGKWTLQLTRTLTGIKNNAPLAKLRECCGPSGLHSGREGAEQATLFGQKMIRKENGTQQKTCTEGGSVHNALLQVKIN